MRKLALLLSVIGLAGLPALATTPHFYFAPDVPQDLPLANPPETTALPWGVVRHNTVDPYTSTTVPPLPIPFGTSIDALHLMNDGRWLFLVEVPTDLIPFAPGTTARADDVVRYDGITYDRMFCGGPFGLPPEANIDAVFLTNQRDDKNLVISFESPTDIGGITYLPADLVELQSTGPLCQSWLIAGYYFDSVTEFGASGAGQIPVFPNVTGADERGSSIVLAFETPTELSGTIYRPGELVRYDPGPKIWSMFHSDAASWAFSAHMNAFSLLAAPGQIPDTGTGIKLEIVKGPNPGDITLTWSPSCSVGAEDYGFYRGTLPALASAWVYNHAAILCTDAPPNFTEVLVPPAGNLFYLVVPHNPNDEGSYGLSWPSGGPGVQRPQGTTTCQTTQELGCP